MGELDGGLEYIFGEIYYLDSGVEIIYLTTEILVDYLIVIYFESLRPKVYDRYHSWFSRVQRGRFFFLEEREGERSELGTWTSYRSKSDNLIRQSDLF